MPRFTLLLLTCFQLHSCLAGGLYELDWLETLNGLRIEGKIYQIGVSIRDYRPADGVDLAGMRLVASQQVVLTLLEQRPAGKLFQAGTGTSGFIARVPLGSGSLVGHWDEGTYAGFALGSVPARLFRGESVCKNPAPGAGTQGALCPLRSDAGQSCDAPCPVLPRIVLRYFGHVEPKTS